jgi:ribonucleoside-diphosphate reductase alpha chain
MYELKGIQKEIWEKKYKDNSDTCIEDTWRRVARWAASAEIPAFRAKHEEEFYSILYDFGFIPGGRITEAAGTQNCYANNCFVLDIEDDLEAIFETIKRTAIISKKNGGTGICFDKIRPANAPLSGGGVGSGVVSFMRVFDTSCEVIKTGSKNRRAALIGILGVSHPEIFEFIDAKRQEGVLTNFNISVSITDDFIEAVEADTDWNLVFNGTIYKTVKARDLWKKLCYSGWMFNDPGIFFKDTTNRYNNLPWISAFSCTNPCGELPLFPWGACCLGNINMTKFVINPFTPKAEFDLGAYYNAISVGVRFLDNILDVTKYPFEENREIAMRDRRIGLNPFAGLGDTLAMMRLPYDSNEARRWVSSIAKQACETAYGASIELAKLKGPFKSLVKDKYLNSNFIYNRFGENNPHIIYGIENHGIRNSALLTCPPVGTGSMLAGNISSGVEPIFALEYNRDFLQPDGSKASELMEDYAWGLFKEQKPNTSMEWFEFEHGVNPKYFKTSMDIDPKDHILMQATIQKYVDGSISKTANLPESYTLEDYESLLMFAWENGLKGFTTFRDGTRAGVLSVVKKGEPKTEVKTNGPEPCVRFTRPEVLDGKTFRVPESNGENAYVTVNWADCDGKKQPWEIFVTRSGSNAEWYAAIGRLASRLMRKTGDVQGVIDELKHIGGDNGYFTEKYGYVKSKPSHIAMIIEDYVNQLNGTTESEKKDTGEQCPECLGILQRLGGCNSCPNCGFSKCG